MIGVGSDGQIGSLHPVLAIEHEFEGQRRRKAGNLEKELPRAVPVGPERVVRPALAAAANRDDVVGSVSRRLEPDLPQCLRGRHQGTNNGLPLVLRRTRANKRVTATTVIVEVVVRHGYSMVGCGLSGQPRMGRRHGDSNLNATWAAQILTTSVRRCGTAPTIRCRHPRDRCIRLPAAGAQPSRAISTTATASRISADAYGRGCVDRVGGVAHRSSRSGQRPLHKIRLPCRRISTGRIRGAAYERVSGTAPVSAVLLGTRHPELRTRNSEPGTWNQEPGTDNSCTMNGCRGVAQPGRALGSGPRGRRFKSSRPDQLFRKH